MCVGGGGDDILALAFKNLYVSDPPVATLGKTL